MNLVDFTAKLHEAAEKQATEAHAVSAAAPSAIDWKSVFAMLAQLVPLILQILHPTSAPTPPPVPVPPSH